ncbi:MAG: exonuclease, partial [Dehalococcoidia bacterium]|nr:exonuclease [Dehalococcoidia bacterium]
PPHSMLANGSINLCAAPLHVGSILSEHLLPEKKSIILTGATLSIEGNFSYIKEQLGLNEVSELLITAPFDYQNSTLLYLATDIPEPGKPGYQRGIETSIINICRASQGRTMALFTSHSALRATYKPTQSALEEDDILVIAQRINGGVKHVLNAFQDTPKSVLLGASSFWEGVDMPGDTLSVVIITKLPFGVPNDPIHEARSELYENSFSQYSLPQAIIKFKQGFGRLIRSKTDRGAVVILDRRLQTRYYGGAFLRSLPHCTVKHGCLHDIPHNIAQWLKR